MAGVLGKVAGAGWPVICLHQGSVSDSCLNEGPSVVCGRLGEEGQPGNPVHGAETVPRRRCFVDRAKFHTWIDVPRRLEVAKK